MKWTINNKIYIAAGVVVLAMVGVAIYKHVRQFTFTSVLYTNEKQTAADSIPVWMRNLPEIKKISDNMDVVIESQYQHNCISNPRPLDKIECDSLAQRRDSLNQQLQNEIHNLNLQNKSQAVIDAAIANIKNQRENQALQVQLKDITDNPYSDNGKNVDIYRDDYGMEYMVDAATNQVVQFAPGPNSSIGFKQTPKLSQIQIKQKAIAYLTKHIADFSKVRTDFTYSDSIKPDGATYAFRWDGKAQGRNMAPFIQVVLSPGGDVESYNDTRSLYQ